MGGTIRRVEKESKETGDLYVAWVLNPDPSKTYSDFRYVNDVCGKLLDFFEEKYPGDLENYLENSPEGVDLADFVIQEFERE